eukprot:COSAG02_NODE_93_length_37477_cov_78.101129_15_plen_111_part_00
MNVAVAEGLTLTPSYRTSEQIVQAEIPQVSRNPADRFELKIKRRGCERVAIRYYGPDVGLGLSGFYGYLYSTDTGTCIVYRYSIGRSTGILWYTGIVLDSERRTAAVYDG